MRRCNEKRQHAGPCTQTQTTPHKHKPNTNTTHRHAGPRTQTQTKHKHKTQTTYRTLYTNTNAFSYRSPGIAPRDFPLLESRGGFITLCIYIYICIYI